MRLRKNFAAAAAVLGATAAFMAPVTATAAPSEAPAAATAGPSVATGVLSYWHDTGETFNRKAPCDARGQQWKNANPSRVIRWKCDWYGTSYHLLLEVRN
ncbi:hypothetical protein ABZS71_13210 [Streptomyces sp. NPDC005393]|uniref:hypothetical protein n=1 Tax=Streptomyces sp. NPDC005393 TaxID=3157041 RepID=UPI0033B880BF